MAGLTPPNGATGYTPNPTIRMEYCGMTELQINSFKLLAPNGSTVETTMALGDYWATLTPTARLIDGTTYTVEAEGRINDSGTIKQILPGTWEFTVATPITDTLVSQDFSNMGVTPPHTFTNATWVAASGWNSTFLQFTGSTHLVADPTSSGRGNVLKIDFSEGQSTIGTTGDPSGFQSQIWSHSGLDELYMSYDIYIPNTFIYNFSMKNTRIGGGLYQSNNDHVTYGGLYCEAGMGFHGNNPSANALATQNGCGPNSGLDGQLGVYQYYVQRFQHNERTGAAYKKGVWQSIELHVKINDPYTSSNGEYHLWQDGVLIKTVTNRQWRNAVDPTLQWDDIRLVFYSGGGWSGCWAAPQNQSFYLDNVIISENPITH